MHLESILRVPDAFQMILSGKEIEHHNIVTSTMLKKEVTYRPVLTVSKGCSRETSVAHIQAVAGTNAK
jgi:hypothetical protein